jgi:hypothetical protein
VIEPLYTPYVKGEMRQSTRYRLVCVLLTVACVCVAAWVGAGPYITLHQIKVAAEAGDVEALEDLVDFPSFKESIKETVKAMMAKQMTKGELRDNPFAGLGMLLATAFIDPMVDAFVSPSGIAALTSGKKPEQPTVQKVPATKTASNNDSTNRSDVQADMGFESLSKFLVKFHSAGKEDGVTLVLKRHGLFWKLSALRLRLSDS